MSRIAKRRLGDIAVAVVSAAFAIVLALLVHRVAVMGQQLTVFQQALSDEQSNVEGLGGEPVAPEPEDLLEDPEYEPLPGPTGPPGPGPTQAQIAAEIAEYFEEHPLLGEPTAAELAAAVASYLADHPAEVPNDRLYEAMAVYFSANPPPAGPPGADGADGQDGADGADGDPGPPPTGAEIQAAVEAYMAEHPLPMCPEGTSPEAHAVVTDEGPLDAVICVEIESTE